MNVIYKILAACIALSVFVGAILAYFIRKVDIEQQIVYDGLGRALSQPPPWAQLFTQEPAWAGAGWHLLDIAVFFGGLFVALWLYGRSQYDPLQDSNFIASAQESKPDEAEMLMEVVDLMASEEYAAKNDEDRRAAITAVRNKHGFSGSF